MNEKNKITFYVNKDEGKTTCVADILGFKYQNSVKTMEGDSYDFAEGLVKSFAKTLLNITYGKIFKDASIKVKNVGKEPIYETQKDLHGLDINGLHFNFSGVDGIYVLDHIAFIGKFDENGNNDWDKSSGKRTLQEWAENNLPKEILERFDVDLPTVDEVFSQKTLNLFESLRELKSKQFPIFQNSDNRMMESDGKPMCWWTRSADADLDFDVCLVNADGGMCNYYADTEYGFVPVLRRRDK